MLYESGYDLRLSTYYGTDGTDLTDSPQLRSKFQKLIGDQNLELQLNKLAEDPRIIESIAAMNRDLQNGNRGREPMEAYYHNKAIGQIFTRARQIAWAQMKQAAETQRLIAEERAKGIETRKSLKETTNLLQMNR